MDTIGYMDTTTDGQSDFNIPPSPLHIYTGRGRTNKAAMAKSGRNNIGALSNNLPEIITSMSSFFS